MNKSVLLAIKKLYQHLGTDSVIEDIDGDTLTENQCRNGRNVLWYLDETNNVAIYIDTLELMTEEEIEKELC